MLTDLYHWLSQYQLLLMWLGGLSAFFFIASLFAAHIVLVRLPYDFFCRNKARANVSSSGFWPGVTKFLRYFLATALVVIGVVLLLLPGQGVLMILLGLALMPLSQHNPLRRLYRHLLRSKTLFRYANGIRQKCHKPPLMMPD